MSIKTASAFEIVRLIDLQPTGFCVLVFPEGEPVFVDDLVKELDIQTGLSSAVIDGAAGTEALLDKLRISQEPVVVIVGLASWSDADFTSLDINRSRLENSAFLVLATDSRTAARLLDRALNIRSFAGASIFAWIPDTALMDEKEIDARLTQLRERYDKSDDAVLIAAREGTLPAEPQFIEWLILLGRGELVR